MEIGKLIELESAKERFMGNEELYEHFLFEFPERTLYAELKETLKMGEVEASFEIAHKLKGVVQNLSLNALGKTVSEIVEALRVGELPDEGQVQAADVAFRETIDGIRYIRENRIQIFDC